MNKCLVVIIDGLGDRPGAALDGYTPLEAAATPVMDSLLARGSCGLVDPLSAGFPVDTHTGAGALMGIARSNLLRLARGPVEAAGIDIDMRDGDVFLRANFATLADDGRRIIDRRAGRISEGTEELVRELRDIDLGDGVSGSVFAATQHRAVIRLRGDALSADITRTDPCSQDADARWLDSQALDPGDSDATRTAAALNRLLRAVHEHLAAHPQNQERELPANALLARGAGVASRPDTLLTRLGMNAAVITGERTLLGLARKLGFEGVHRPGFTAGPDTDLAGKFDAALDALGNNDLVYLHIKATDIYSHDRDPVGKKNYIERIDRALDVVLDSELVIGISADHSTDSNTGNHCGDPVPSLVCAPGCRIDAVEHFGERDCVRGGLGRIQSSALLLHMLDLAGALPNYQPFYSQYIDQR